MSDAQSLLLLDDDDVFAPRMARALEARGFEVFRDRSRGKKGGRDAEAERPTSVHRRTGVGGKGGHRQDRDGEPYPGGQEDPGIDPLLGRHVLDHSPGREQQGE